MLAGIETERVQPDLAHALAESRIAQLVQANAVMAGIGKGRVNAPGAGELRVQLQRPPDIDQHDKRRPALLRGQVANVFIGLIMRGQHRLIPTVRRRSLAGLLGFEDEALAVIQIDVAAGHAAVGMADLDPALEHVGVAPGVVAGRLRLRQVQRGAQLGQEDLPVGPLAAEIAAPTGDKGFEPFGGGVREVVGGHGRRSW